MANETLTTEKLLKTLQRFAPAKVRAYSGDDDARDIAVPTRRKKWSQVIAAIEARSWTRVELLDKSGAVLAYVDNVEPARELEDLDGGKASKVRSETEWMVKLVISAQRDAMTFRDAEVKSLLTAQGDVVREMSAAMRDLGAIYREQRESATASATARAEAAAAAAAGGDSFKELMEALPQILQALPMLRALLQQPQTAPNGARPKNGA